MKAAMILIAMCATPLAHAEPVCLTRLGHVRVRAEGCRPEERAFALGAKTLAVVDKDGELVGYAIGPQNGYAPGQDPFIVFRTIGTDTIAVPVNARGLVPFGSDLLATANADCTGAVYLDDLGDARNDLLKGTAVWPDRAWYATGTAQVVTTNAYIVPPIPGSDFTCDPPDVRLADGFCCVPSPGLMESMFVATAFQLASAHLEPPFRLSLEP